MQYLFTQTICRKILSCKLFALIGVIFTVNLALADSLLEPQIINPETTSGLQALYQTLDYEWPVLEDGVPPLILKSIPQDIDNSVPTEEKKKAFFMGLLPMVLLANKEIAEERREIQQILKRRQNRQANEEDRQRIAEISKRYGLRGRPFVDHRARTRLIRRVDTIAPALVLAQAANESAWGTSRFARLGNNLFGEWTFKPGTGIVPEGRPLGETYEVRKFSSLYESVRSYMNNLNRHNAYRQLREIRATLRNSQQQVTGKALAKGLLKYSQRGKDYINEIQAMIRQNELEMINTASLRRPVVTEEVANVSTVGAGLFSSRNRMIGHFSPSRHNP